MKSNMNYIRLEDICDELSDGLHKAPVFVPGGEYIFVNATNLENGQIVDKDIEKHTTYEEFLKYGVHLTNRTILYSIDGTIGNIARYNGEKCVLGKGACYLNIKEDVDVEYIFYQLQSPHFKSYIYSMSTGSTIRHISLKTMRNYKFYLPCLDIQKRIVKILSAFDDKIDLNNKINENLEQQARAVFSNWKAKNIRNYQPSPLSAVADINSDTYSLRSSWEYVNYLDTSSITDGIISEIQCIDPSLDKLPSRARRVIKPNDIVFSTVRPNQHHFGIISEPVDNMLASTGFAVIRSKLSSISNEALYLCLTENSFLAKMQQLAEQSTSTFPSIKPSDLDNCEIPYPISQELNKNLVAIYAVIASKRTENRKLAELRDALLPKLMNGEIDLDGI